jgi:hypothetical protein
MMGLFGWAGAQAAVSPVSVVHSFISAFDHVDCQTMSSELYVAPGGTPPTCKQLDGGGGTKLLHCKLVQTSTPTVAGQTEEKVPAGYEDPGFVRASCLESGPATKGKAEPLVLDIFVATVTATDQQQIISLQVAGA